ncbi:CheR family methyltransferase [Altericista sp. CCNU0014]|uniref:CheR family methyltransferase n=1 Tax=Altericista sp. CCNU0014 TaxID=3082949 RepID=UPI00384DCDCC
MNPALLEEFCHLITVKTGLKIREQDRLALSKCIAKRVQALELSGAEAYYHLLQEALSQATQGWAKHPELQILAPAITTGESYFLRDRGQIEILEHHLLPELIRQKREACLNGRGLKPALKIWSAGCSTGEEVYTLATLVKKLLPDWQHWNVSILGTDLNPEAIERAKRGVYKRWSFRQTPPEFQKQYFREHADGWEIEPSLRKFVLFQPMNLLQSRSWSENPHLQDIDLILCRNVFIYFKHDAIATILKQFYAALNPDGYLITGHSELQGQDMGQFKLLLFPESVVYQRSLAAEPISTTSATTATTIAMPSNGTATPKKADRPTATVVRPLQTPIRKPVEPATSKTDHSVRIKTAFQANADPAEKPAEILEKVRQLLSQGRYTAALTTTEPLLEQNPNCSEVYYLRAQAYANQGDLAQAIAACEQSLRLNPDFLEPLYLLAQIAEEQQNPHQCKAILKKILYLDPTSIAAYIDLGTHYINEGESARAQKMFQSAWELLQPLPPERQVCYRGNVSVRSLQNHLKILLSNRSLLSISWKSKINKNIQ